MTKGPAPDVEKKTYILPPSICNDIWTYSCLKSFFAFVMTLERLPLEMLCKQNIQVHQTISFDFISEQSKWRCFFNEFSRFSFEMLLIWNVSVLHCSNLLINVVFYKEFFLVWIYWWSSIVQLKQFLVSLEAVSLW